MLHLLMIDDPKTQLFHKNSFNRMFQTHNSITTARLFSDTIGNTLRPYDVTI